MTPAPPAVLAARPAVPAAVAERARPVALAGDRLLPVLPALQPLLPEGGLRRGSVVAAAGSTSLALALVAAASAAGSWGAAVGVGRPPLGPVAAAELGVVLERFPLVAAPSGSGPAAPGRAARGGWPWVVAALLDAVDVVVAWPPSRLRATDARRLAARARERGAVLVIAATPFGHPAATPFGHGAATPFGHGAATPFGHGAATPFGHPAGWPEAVDVRLAVVASTWEGIGDGHGRLLARRVEVEATGRGAAARPRRATLWLPAPGGGAEAFSGAATPLRGGQGSGKAVGG